MDIIHTSSRKMAILLFTFILLSFCSCKISTISPSSLTNTQNLHLVEVYDENTCTQCGQYQKILQEVQQLLQNVVKISVQKVSVKELPKGLIKIRGNVPSVFLVIDFNNREYVEFKEKISRGAVIRFVLGEIQKSIKAKQTKIYGASEQKQQKPKQNKQKQQSSNKNAQKDGSGVIVLTDANFEETVLKSDEAWFIQFYSPSCGHCVALQPEFDKLPQKMGKRVKIAKIDATVNRQMAQKYQIKGFPTLFFFQIQNKQTPVPYQSQRTAQAMSSWLQSQKIGEQKLQFLKLSEELYTKQCNRNVICLIFILQKKTELQQLDFIEQILQESKGKPLRFFYSQRRQHFEQTLMIEDRSTPKLVSIWDSLNSYKIYNSDISKQNISQFLSKIMQRRTWVKLNEKVSQTLFNAEKGNQEL